MSISLVHHSIERAKETTMRIRPREYKAEQWSPNGGGATGSGGLLRLLKDVVVHKMSWW